MREECCMELAGFICLAIGIILIMMMVVEFAAMVAKQKQAYKKLILLMRQDLDRLEVLKGELINKGQQNDLELLWYEVTKNYLSKLAPWHVESIRSRSYTEIDRKKITQKIFDDLGWWD